MSPGQEAPCVLQALGHGPFPQQDLAVIKPSGASPVGDFHITNPDYIHPFPAGEKKKRVHTVSTILSPSKGGEDNRCSAMGFRLDFNRLKKSARDGISPEKGAIKTHKAQAERYRNLRAPCAAPRPPLPASAARELCTGKTLRGLIASFTPTLQAVRKGWKSIPEEER